jgi:hypothetical protein
MKPAVLEITLTFKTAVLGTAPSNPNIYADYVADEALKNGAINGARLQEELDALPVDEDRGSTVFRRDDQGRPCFIDYMVKGFFKETCTAQKRFDESLSKGITLHKVKINDTLFITPQFIPILMQDGTTPAITMFQRPLRAETPQGPRVALASSECIQPGAQITFTVQNFATKLLSKEVIVEWLTYGLMRGLGQFRNGGFGRFRTVITATSGSW